MKAWLLIISIFVIFATVCSPVLAISKLELIARYKGEMAPDTSIGVVIINFTTQPPTPTPTPYIPSGFPKPSLDWPYPDFLKPFSKPNIPSSPIVKPSTGIQLCPPAVPVGEVHLLLVFVDCEPDEDCNYPVGMDRLGSKYFIKPGCQCKLAY